MNSARPSQRRPWWTSKTRAPSTSTSTRQTSPPRWMTSAPQTSPSWTWAARMWQFWTPEVGLKRPEMMTWLLLCCARYPFLRHFHCPQIDLLSMSRNYYWPFLLCTLCALVTLLPCYIFVTLLNEQIGIDRIRPGAFNTLQCIGQVHPNRKSSSKCLKYWRAL